MSPLTPTPNCPDAAVLEALRTGETHAELDAHVASCVECRRTIEFGADLSAELRLHERIVPAERDAAMQGLLVAGAAGIRKRRLRKRVALGGLAAAASLVLVAGLSSLQREEPSAARETAKAAVVEGDLTGDGRLDVLDAFALARALEAGQSPAASWDFNGDGHVDGADVDALARSAVDLGRPS